MIPEYCYDCMSRQMPMNQVPGTPSLMPGQQAQGMFQPVHGTAQGSPQQPFQAPMGTQGMQEQMMPQGPVTSAPPVDFTGEQGPPVQRDIGYTQGWLRTQIGKRVKVEFIIGTNSLIDREGTLLDVGISYILMREAETDDLLMADIYSIKFVRVYF